MTCDPKFKVGDHVASWNSGLAYLVYFINESDSTGECFTYTVRRLRGGVPYGASRRIGESGLCSLGTGEVKP